MVMEVDPVTSMLFLNDTFQMVMILTYQSLGATLQLVFHSGWAPLTTWGCVVLVLFCTPFGLVHLQFGVISNIINSGLDMS